MFVLPYAVTTALAYQEWGIGFPRPIRGIVTIGFALSSAEPGDEARFTDPDVREFVRRSLNDGGRCTYGACSNINHGIAKKHYYEIYGQDPSTRASRKPTPSPGRCPSDS